MIHHPSKDIEQSLSRFVRDWFQMLSLGEWEKAFKEIDLPPTHGERFTPESFRNEIENDHFCEGTIFRKKYPLIIYSDPYKVSSTARIEFYEPENLEGYELEFDVPLNGEWSDLTSGWQFIRENGQLLVKLDWLHVL